MIKSSNYFFLKIVEDIGTVGKDLEHRVLCNTLDDGNCEPFPVCLANADVLPDFFPGTTVFGQAVCYVTSIKTASTLEGLRSKLKESELEDINGALGSIFMDKSNKCINCRTWGRMEMSGITKDLEPLRTPDGLYAQHPELV